MLSEGSGARLFAAISSAALVVALLGASSASASKILGAPEFQNPGNKYIDGTLVQTASPGKRYEAPGDGVITSWSKFASFDPKKLQQLKLKVARETAGNWQIVGESNLETLTDVGVRNTFPTRIPVKLGDVIGLYGLGEQIMVWIEEGYAAHGKLGADVISGSQEFLEPTLQYWIVVDAVWEPDVDGDGFGDESQDSCLGFAGAAPCPSLSGPPVTKPSPKKTRCKKGFKRVKVKGKAKCKKIKKGRKGKGHRK